MENNLLVVGPAEQSKLVSPAHCRQPTRRADCWSYGSASQTKAGERGKGRLHSAGGGRAQGDDPKGRGKEYGSEEAGLHSHQLHGENRRIISVAESAVEKFT